MRHQVHFRETGSAGIPAIDPQRDVMLQQATRPGATVEASLGGGFVGAQPAVDLAGADRKQLALYLGAEMKMLSHPGHPERDQGLQPHRPGITRRPPDGLQHRYQLLAVGGPPSRGVIGLRLCPTGRRPVQQPQGILAVVFRVRAKLVQNLPLHFARCLAVTSVNGSQVFPYALPSHPNPPSKALCRVTLSDGLTARVTFLNGLTAPYWLHLKRLYSRGCFLDRPRLEFLLLMGNHRCVAGVGSSHGRWSDHVAGQEDGNHR